MPPKRQNKTIRKSHKPKLLLDEGLPPRLRLHQLNQNYNYNVKHIKNDLDFGGLGDEEVYKIASKQNRILVTFNIKDFRLILNKEGSSIIAVSTRLSTEQIDIKLCSFLREIQPSQFLGKIIRISGETKR